MAAINDEPYCMRYKLKSMVRLDPNYLRKHIKLALEADLLEEHNSKTDLDPYYTITDRGRKFMHLYEEMRRLLFA